MRLQLCMVFAFVFAATVPAFAQQAPSLSPQEQLERAVLELAYTEREHKMCRQSLGDMWARANALEKQVQDLTTKLKTLKEPAGDKTNKK